MGGVVLLVSLLARAESPSAVAEALFQEGRQLLERGDLARACPKLAESQRLEPSSGTLLNVADCHEREGKTATAWAEFQAAARMARAQGRAVHAAEAERRAERLAGQVSHVEVRLDEPVAGVQVRLAGVALAEGSLDSRLPVDPGEVEVAVEAPGYTPWSRRVTVAPGPGVQRVVVPRLERRSTPAASSSALVLVPPLPPTSAPSAPTPAPWPARRTAALVVGGAGVIALGVGSILGLAARSTYLDAHRLCPTHEQCGPGAIERRDRADTLALGSDAGFGLGLAAAAVAGYLWLSARPDGEAAGSARWWVRPGGAGVQGAF